MLDKHGHTAWRSFFNTNIQLGRSIWSYDKVQRVVGAVRRNKKIFARLPEKGEYLDVGCGPNRRPGFCGIDYQWRPGHVDICWNITKGIPIPDNWVGGIYTEHCLEHIKIEQFYNVAKEFFRIMMPLSYIRIIVPSLELFAEKYHQNLIGAQTEMPSHHTVNGDYTPAMSINAIFLNWGHEFIYDFETMKLILMRAGFCDIQQQTFGLGSDPKLLIDTPYRQVESLYVEARKPG
jgi:predicted SAM-dependent methyltransferase